MAISKTSLINKSGGNVHLGAFSFKRGINPVEAGRYLSISVIMLDKLCRGRR